jgi:DNA polymerase elongation subunit (family B)|tara:strand:- start:8085 stop:9041 length:957 start_codon:yes stop_codon:yes gene_type:complete
MKVVYGHTDSIYVQIGSVEKAQKVIKEIENEVRKKFPNVLGLEQHPVVLEFEKYYSALGVGATKNRNAGLVSWDDGVWLDKPKFTMTGFTAKRVSETTLSKGVQIDVLNMWVEGKSQNYIVKELHNKYVEVLSGKTDKRDVIKRSRLKEERFKISCPKCKKKYSLHNLPEVCDGTFKDKDISIGGYISKPCMNPVKNFSSGKRKDGEYKSISIGQGIEGIIAGQQSGEFDFTKQGVDSYFFVRTRNKNTKYIHPVTKETRYAKYYSAPSLNYFEDVEPDWEHYAESVIKKAQPVFDAMGWDSKNIKLGTIQTGLDEWF